jgi:acetyl esterase/lipase
VGLPLPAQRKVVPHDTSTTTVIDTTGAPQIRHAGADFLTGYTDVVYATYTRPDGTAAALRMDIDAPATGGLKPLVLFLPAGGFHFAPKEAVRHLRTHVAEAGFVVAGIEYRTASAGATYVQSIEDVKSAIRFLRAESAAYGIDPARVAVWGESAGGYMAAMVGTTNGEARLDVGAHTDQSSVVQAVVDQYGYSDLARVDEDYDDVDPAEALHLAAYVNGPAAQRPLDQQPGDAADANPIEHIGPNTPPFLIFHGTADTMVSPNQTLLLHNALLEARVSSERYVLEGAGHGDLGFLGDRDSGLPWSTAETMGIITRFLHQHLDP